MSEPKVEPLTTEKREYIIRAAQQELKRRDNHLAHRTALSDLLEYEALVVALEAENARLAALHAKHCGMECCDELDRARSPLGDPK